MTGREYKESYTFEELVDVMERAGANNAEFAIGKMMDTIEAETGSWPNWEDAAPDWVVRNCLG